MYSSNPSFESLRSSRSEFYKSSQINPNSSVTNLISLNHKFEHPSPKRFFQTPITPPISNAASPIKENLKFIEQRFESYKVVVLCVNWYLSSIISNYSTKLILQDFTYPITLTQFQFILNSVFSIALLSVLMNNRNLISRFPQHTLPNFDGLTIRKFITPDRFILNTTIPMGIFQFVGHVTSHNATSIIPVSLNHTIKALSPITTVLIYRFLFQIKYHYITYITLIPLICGIMLSCYKTSSNKVIENYNKGLMFSFISMLIFVSQNIFAKNRLTINNLLPNSQKEERKLDKLTILYYCSIIGFLFTLPVYIILEFKAPHLSLGDLNTYNMILILINGVSHFIQSLLAFQILGLISPINYSIANILKRIIIILVAFIIEGKSLTLNQIFGISLTFIGLFAYDRWGMKKSLKK